VQDGRGFLWAATAGGVARFDGREFREYPLPATAPNAPYNIRDLVVEDDSTLMVLPAAGGVLRLRDGVFSEHPVNGAVSAAANGKTLLNFFIAPDGAVWFGLDTPSVLRWDAGKLTELGAAEGLVRRVSGRSFFASDGEGRTWISSGDFLGWYRDGKFVRVPVETKTAIVIATARSGGIWVSTAEQLWKWDQGRLAVVCAKSAWLTPTVGVQQMYEDRGGALWIGTRREGLFRLTTGKPLPVATEHFQITAVTEDNEGNIWVSMDGGGINRLRAKTFAVLDSNTGLADDISTSVCEDAFGMIWCANRAGGVVRMEAGRRTRSFNRTPDGWPIYASNISPDKEGNIWIGALNALYRMPADMSRPIERMQPDIQPVRILHCTQGGDMWVGWGFQRGGGFKLGRFRGGVYQPFSAVEGFHGKHVHAIAEALDGAVWIGTDEGELFEFRDGKFVPHASGDEPSVGRIHALHFDTRGGLWIGSERGLVLYEKGQSRRFTRAEGLPDDLITQMLEDDYGRLWLCSRRGFFSVSIEELRHLPATANRRVIATTFGKDEGLPGISSPTGGQPMSWKARDGRLWFVTNRGVVGFDPKTSFPLRSPPTVYIDETLIDGKTVSGGAALDVPAGSHRVEFRFVALNYSAPGKVRMRHQLVGFDQDWIETEAERSAAYVRLPPGHYIMRVIASNQDGQWNNVGASLAVTVAPAWWQTWWWRLGGFFAFTGAVAALARYFFLRRLKLKLERLEREHALEKERARIARDLHDDLGGSLTQIGMLADRIKRQASETTLKPALAQLAWRTRRLAGELESIVWTVSPKNDTLDRLAAFIAQSARSFFNDTSVECVIEGSENIPPIPVSPETQHHLLAVMKEALNNVLKHANANRITISMAAEGGEFVLRIADEGVGFDPAAAEHSERNGLSNMRSRMADLGGTVEIQSIRGQGTDVVIRQRLHLASPEPRLEVTTH
jgi:signal transduction histidine kinase/ligand-binding sensor domain-containing protein